MIIRHFLAACLALTSAAISAAHAQSRTTSGIANPAIPPPAVTTPSLQSTHNPSLAPTIQPGALPPMPKPAPAPVLATPNVPFGGAFGDDLVSVGGGGASAAGAAPSPATAAAPPSPAPSYSDICQATPKPPWCGDGAAAADKQ